MPLVFGELSFLRCGLWRKVKSGAFLAMKTQSRFSLRTALMACIGMAYLVMAYTVMAHVLMAHIVMACLVAACMVIAYMVMAYTVMSYTAMAYLVMAYIALAYVVMEDEGCCAVCSDVWSDMRPDICVHLFLATFRGMPTANAEG